MKVVTCYDVTSLYHYFNASSFVKVITCYDVTSLYHYFNASSFVKVITCSIVSSSSSSLFPIQFNFILKHLNRLRENYNVAYYYYNI